MSLPLTDPRPDPPNRTAKLVFTGHAGGAPWVNVMWLYLTGSGEITTGDLNTLAHSCFTEYKNRFLPLLHEYCELQTATVTLYEDGDALNGVYASAQSGSADRGALMPAQVALCISWQIPFAYRGGHPRTYLAGIPFGAMASTNSWEATYLTSANSQAVDFHDELEGLGPIGDGIETVEHGIVSFQKDGAWRTPPLFRRIVTGYVDNRIDTQRRRLGPDVA